MFSWLNKNNYPFGHLPIKEWWPIYILINKWGFIYFGPFVYRRSTRMDTCNFRSGPIWVGTYVLATITWELPRGWLIIVRRAGLLWSQQDFEWRWSVPLFKCPTVLEFSFILFDLCLLITFFNFIMNYVPIVTFWIFTYHKFWILSIMFCFIWSYWIIYFLACLEVSWRVVS